jgi:hypothetical protein
MVSGPAVARTGPGAAPGWSGDAVSGPAGGAPWPAVGSSAGESVMPERE